MFFQEMALYCLLFVASINGIILPTSILKSATSLTESPHVMADSPNLIPDAKEGPLIPHESLPQVFGPVMKEKSFKDAFEISLRWRVHGTNPLDRQDLNPLALHNANLDDQYALRKWILILDSDTDTNQKKSFILKKLLENPTVDFTKISHLDIEKVIDLGDLENFKILYDKVYPLMDPGHFAEYAVQKREFGIFRCLLKEKKVLDQAQQNDILWLQYKVAGTGLLNFVHFLFDEFKFTDGRNIEINPGIQVEAAASGSFEVLKYIFEKYETTYGTKFPVDPKIQIDVAYSGNLDFIKYIFEKYEAAFGTFPIDPSIQYFAAKSGNLDLVKYIFEKYKTSFGSEFPISPIIQFNAAESGNLDLMKYIFQKYEAINSEKFPIDLGMENQAARSGNLNVLKYVLKKYKEYHGSEFPIHSSVQFHATKSGNLDILRYVIDEKRVPINFNLIMKGLHRMKPFDPVYEAKVLKYMHDKKLGQEFREFD